MSLTFLLEKTILIEQFRNEKSFIATFIDYSRNPPCKYRYCSQEVLDGWLVNLIEFRTSYWSVQLTIAIIRYVFVMFPTEVHNLFPNSKYKNKLFLRIIKWGKLDNWKILSNKVLVFRFSLYIPLLQLGLDLTVDKLFGFNDILLQDCLDIRPDTDVRIVQIYLD